MHSEKVFSELYWDIWRAAISGRPTHAGPGYPQVSFEFIRQILVGSGPSSPRAVNLSGASITGDLDLEGATVVCPIQLTDCRMGEWNLEQVEAPGIYLARCSLKGIRGSQLHTKGSFAIKDCLVTGTIQLGGAKIDGQLVLTDTRILNDGHESLSADGLTVGQDLICKGRFISKGHCHLVAARVQGQFNAMGATFHNRDGVAFDVSNALIGEIAHWEALTADGAVYLNDTQVLGSLNCCGATFRSSQCWAILAEGLEVRRDLMFDANTVVKGSIDLRRASVGELHDEDFNWPERVLLAQFTYGALRPFDDTKGRINWLKRNGSYYPQIYRQLAHTYRASGYLKEAKEVLIAEEWACRRTPDSRLSKLYTVSKGAVLWATVRYGFSPLRILWSLAFLEIAGGILFSTLRDDISLTQAASKAHASFQPWLYSLDLLLPVVSLRQRDMVIAHHSAAWCSALFIILGWMLATALVIGVGSAMKRTE